MERYAETWCPLGWKKSRHNAARTILATLLLALRTGKSDAPPTVGDTVWTPSGRAPLGVVLVHELVAVVVEVVTADVVRTAVRRVDADEEVDHVRSAVVRIRLAIALHGTGLVDLRLRIVVRIQHQARRPERTTF